MEIPQSYISFISENTKDWKDSKLSLLYCANGVVEESFELISTDDELEKLSEQGDVVFYLTAFYLQAWGTSRLNYACKFLMESPNFTTEKSLMESSIILMKMVSKHIFHGNELVEKKVFDETINILYLMFKQTNNSLEEILQANMIKLNMRYPKGRDMKYVTKDVTSENMAIKKYLEEDDKTKNN